MEENHGPHHIMKENRYHDTIMVENSWPHPLWGKTVGITQLRKKTVIIILLWVKTVDLTPLLEKTVDLIPLWEKTIGVTPL